MNKNYTVFVIIVTYNGMRNNWIGNCLSSLANSRHAVKAIVVDNDSSDNTSDFIRQEFPDVVVLQQNTNLGFGQANNIGIRYAISKKADYIMLLNQDATITEDCVGQLLAEADGQSVLSPIHCNGEGNKLDRMFCFTLSNACNIFFDDMFIQGKLKGQYVVGEVPAACWFLPVNTVLKIGGFNPLFCHYGEDNNYYHRLRFHGIKMLLVPKARMYHHRKLFGDAKVFNKNKLKRDMLLITSNINNGFGTRLMLFAKLLYRCYIQDLKAKSYKPGSYLLSLCWMLCHYNRIAKSRKTERNQLGCWLNEL